MSNLTYEDRVTIEVSGKVVKVSTENQNHAVECLSDSAALEAAKSISNRVRHYALMTYVGFNPQTL